MSGDYAPTTDEVRQHYGESCSWHHPGRDQREVEWDAAKERFDRWHAAEIAAAERRGAERGWNEAIERVKLSHGIGIDPRYYRAWRGDNPYSADREETA